MNFPKSRFGVAVVFFSIAIACLVQAKPKLSKTQIAKIRQECGELGKFYYNQCIKNCPGGCTDADVERCSRDAEGEDIACLRREGVLMPRDTADGIGQVSPPDKSNPNRTRQGPGQTAPPNKSHPTPTPRKGPDKTGTSGIGHASPTPSSTPVLLEKKNTPTPTPSPHKSGVH